jgi:hypothetical protein
VTSTQVHLPLEHAIAGGRLATLVSRWRAAEPRHSLLGVTNRAVTIEQARDALAGGGLA